MSADFSAGAQTLGYLYQVRYALYLLIKSKEESSVSVESLDDIVFEDSGASKELLQLKHHLDKKGAPTDSSSDLWKTIRIWSSHIYNNKITIGDSILTLITTATVPDKSIASMLQDNNKRDTKKSLEKLIEIANTSKNEKLQSSFDEFKKLSSKQKKALVEAIYIIDSADNIIKVESKIKSRIEFSTRRESLVNLYERLEGWWFDKIVKHINDKSINQIPRFEVYDKILELSDQFKPDALPIDFSGALPNEPVDPENDGRCFVLQLKSIGIKSKRIEFAILDYYRAFQQRSKWAREDLLIGDELEKYEKRLLEEWERYFFSLEDDNPYDESDEKSMQDFGKKIYTWMENNSGFSRIRPQVNEPYVTRGSFHILSDSKRVWWHPKFVERLEALLNLK